MKELKFYIDQFAKLRRAPGAVWSEATKKQAPHKPLLLLAIMDLIYRGVIKSSFIDIKGDLNELNELFSVYWRRVVPLAQKSSIAFPFSRLHNEQFWKLIPVEGKEITQAEISNISNVSQLREIALGAMLDKDLYYYFSKPDSRNALREVLLHAYFSEAAGNALREQIFINLKAFDYSEELERQSHMPLVREAVQEIRFEEEVRDQGFRRAVVKAYDHRCALCGVRIITPEGHTVVDAAHIQPWSVNHYDDIRNGLALCKICHWAFDKGMLGISDDYAVITASQLNTNQNLPGFILTLSDRKIISPTEEAQWPAQEYIQWHRKEILYRTE